MFEQKLARQAGPIKIGLGAGTGVFGGRADP